MAERQLPAHRSGQKKPRTASRPSYRVPHVPKRVVHSTTGKATAGSAFIGDLAFELSAIASKVPAGKGRTAPDFALPFTPEDYAKAVDGAAVCPLPQG